MGVRGTDDYLTARAANPRTGLISPSVVTVQTPRTPLTPGEALLLYSEGQLTTTGEFPSDRAGSPSSNSRPQSRWRQNSKAWVTETLTENTPHKFNEANSSVSRTDHNPSEDRFIIPMPSAKEPQPYMNLDPATLRDTAAGSCKKNPIRMSQHGISNQLIDRPPSVGAGPRKFAEATRALKTYNATLEDIPAEQEVHINSFEAAKHAEDLFSKRSSLVAFPRIENIPGSLAHSSDSPASIARKPLGPRPLSSGRRDSGVEMGTATSLGEKTSPNPALPLNHNNRVRADSNTSRFQDLRQLPRVRLVHPDLSESSSVPGSKEQTPHTAQRVYTIPNATSTRPPPHPRHSITPGSHPATLDTPIPLGSLSPLETQIMGFLAWGIGMLFDNRKTAQDQGLLARSGILQAIHTLSDADVSPLERFAAVKTLCFVAIRAVVVIGCLVAVMRVAAAIGKLLMVIFWPVSLVLAVVKWTVGLR